MQTRTSPRRKRRACRRDSLIRHADAKLTNRTGLVGRIGGTIGIVVAYDQSDHEVARHGPGLCMGDTWVIGNVGPNPTSWTEHDR